MTLENSQAEHSCHDELMFLKQSSSSDVVESVFSDTFSDLFNTLFINNWSVANLTIVIISSFFRLFVFLALSITAALLALLIVFSASFFFLVGAFFFSTSQL
jgi:hypothetical protein